MSAHAKGYQLLDQHLGFHETSYEEHAADCKPLDCVFLYFPSPGTPTNMAVLQKSR
jgi:hypothetical protein